MKWSLHIADVRDLLWPLPDPLLPDQIAQHENGLAAEIAALPKDENPLKKHIETFEGLLDQEKERRQSVETRLTTIMGLASIAGTIVFGTILAQTTGTLRVPQGILRVGIAVGSLYLVLQICSAIFAAVRGLSVRAYLALTPMDFLNTSSANGAIHLHEFAAMQLRHLADHQSQNNVKVTWMAVAHRAMQQFLFGLLALALFSTCFALITPAAHDDLTETLKRNHELQDLLRGPAGPPGPAGPAGSAGPAGPAGKPCQTLGNKLDSSRTGNK